MGADAGREPRFPALSLLRRIDINSPVVQSAVILGIQPVLMGTLRAFRLDGAIWLAAAGLLLLFALLNPFLGLRARSYLKYMFESAALFTVLFFLSAILADRISRISLEEYGPEAMIFLAPVLYYPFSIIAALAVRLLLRRKGRAPRDGSAP